MNVIQAIAAHAEAAERCKAGVGLPEWKDRHTRYVERLVAHFMPHGSGFDAGTKIDWQLSGSSRIVFTTSFHHMNEGGYYDGWSEHSVIVTPAFDGFNVRVTGRDRNDIKSYIGDAFHDALRQDVDAFRAEQQAQWKSEDADAAALRG